MEREGKMNSRTNRTKRRRDLAKAREAGSRLCEAVSAWIKELGGVPLAITDLTAKEISKSKYRLSVVVRGTLPKSRYELK